ncbi:MAG TPA: hypothetical protein VKM35_02145 [Arenimonas sp.]|uniref:hypothetical protein n=1 Tax=Arenimonas sp. TaxID=1872635 RepID=UPI002CFDB8DC|nr:hypothetical protein [Arenimonas sp.]HMB55989.1 hypothetical protein [Arenimonas sp.]
MKTSIRALVISTLALSPVCLAANCRPVDPSIAQGLNVAAPEMRWNDEATVACISAEEVIALARAEAARVMPVAPVVRNAPTPASTDARGYVPKTKDDNTPWRFDMNQNGKRMTAVEFDAWMKAKGITVATGKPADAAATPPAAPVDDKKKK